MTTTAILKQRYPHIDYDAIDVLVERMNSILDVLEKQGVHCDPKLEQELDAIDDEVWCKLKRGEPPGWGRLLNCAARLGADAPHAAPNALQ